jgi:putative exosortase-associated protein (TIGR04073 family)
VLPAIWRSIQSNFNLITNAKGADVTVRAFFCRFEKCTAACHHNYSMLQGNCRALRIKGESSLMKALFLAVAIVVSTLLAAPSFATEAPKPENIAEKMSFKLVRGTTNFFTAIAEIPKQTILTGRNHGAIGYVVGPIKGVGMTLYRGFIGLTEAVFFMVPQPGYYDPMIDPEFVWEGWDDPRGEMAAPEQKGGVKE